MHFDRRRFLQLGIHSGVAFLSFSPLSKVVQAFNARSFNSEFPLRPFSGPFDSPAFNGDDVRRAHDRLWNLAAYIASRGGRPPVSESRDVIIVGGGASGLSSAFLLQDRNPLLLEQDSQFGGNSRGEVFSDTAFSIGAAYITIPEEGSVLHRLLSATGVLRAARIETEDQSRVHVRGRGFQSLWRGEADPRNAQMIAKVSHDLAQIAENAYPEIPFENGALSRQQLDALDRLSFQQWLQQTYGNSLPGSVLEYFQLYCWSSFGGSVDEISAAQALNFLAAETGGIMTFPGGNSYITQGLYAHLRRGLAPDSLRTGHLVLEIKSAPDGVHVLAEVNDRLVSYKCKACVIAAPKYVARSIVPEMTAAQRQAVGQLHYRAYVVANVLVNGRVSSPGFDTFCLEGQAPPTPTFRNPPTRAFPDVCFANWANGDRGARSVLTIYKPYPYDGARNVLINESSFQRIRSEVAQGAGEILTSLGLSPAAIAGIRMTRWGHAIPLARPGFMGEHHDLALLQPTAGRIFYANQDNAANPSFETALASAVTATTHALRLL